MLPPIRKRKAPFAFGFRIGARYSVLLGALLVGLGTAVRTLTTNDDGFLICCHVGQFLNGASGVMVLSMPPLISALWFPDNERILATAIAQVRYAVFSLLGC